MLDKARQYVVEIHQIFIDFQNASDTYEKTNYMK